MSSRITRNEYSWSSSDSPSSKLDRWDLERKMDRDLCINDMFGENNKFKQTENSTFTNEDGTQMFRIKLDVSQYDPNDIQIKTNGNQVEIIAQTAGSADGNTASSKFRKRFNLPEGVNPDAIEPVFTKDSYLLIEAPIKTGGDEIVVAKSITSDASPKIDSPQKKKVLDEIENTVVVDDQGNKKMKILVDIGSFDPSNVEIETKKYFIKIRAEQIEKSGRKSSTVEMSKRLTLPSGVDHDHITTSFSEDGILLIEAPVESSESDDVLGIEKRNIDSISKIPRVRQIENTTKIGKDGKKMMLIKLDVGKVDDNDIEIKAIGNSMEIKMKYTMEIDGRKSTSEYKKRFNLPEEADIDRITSKLNDKGILTLEAPMKSKNDRSPFLIKTQRE